MTKDIDYLIIAEKEDQALHIAAGIFDKVPKSFFNISKFRNDLKRSDKEGLGGTDLSSVLDGNVRIVRAQGHLFKLDAPWEQTDLYARKGEPVVDEDFGVVLDDGYRTDNDLLDVYPVELPSDGVKWHAGSPKALDLAKNIKDKYVRSKNIIVASDFDNEGEMIFYNWQHCMIGDSKVDWSKIYRAKINDLTPKPIRESFSHLIPYTSNDIRLTKMLAAGKARSILDYEYGMSFSLWGRLFQDQFGGKGAYGRVRNPLLGVVYRSELAHDNFKASSQFRVDMQLSDGTTLKGATQNVSDDLLTKYKLSDNGLLFDTREEAQNYIDKNVLPFEINLKQSSKDALTLSPALFSRNELLVAAGNRFSQLLPSGQKWGDVLQKLYERATLLSYIRTDSRYIFESDYDELRKVVDDDFVQSLLSEIVRDTMTKHDVKTDDLSLDSKLTSNKRWVDDKKAAADSHYAIIPTTKIIEDDAKTNIYPSLSPVEKAVYKLDLSRTLAMFANPSVVEQYAYIAVDGLFTDSRHVTKINGWRLLTDDVLADDTITPAGQQKVTYVISEVKAKRPSLFTPQSLLSLMKRQNWGTSATRDNTIAELTEAGAFVLDKGKLRIRNDLKPTIDVLLKEGLIDFDLTTRVQKDLDKLSSKEDRLAFLSKTRTMNKQLNQTVKEYIRK